MAKYNLLEIVQKVLSSVDGDEVNSISETVEAQQIAEIVEDVYYNMVTNRYIPEHEELGRLEALADSDHPNYLKILDNVSEIKTVRYNKQLADEERINYQPVTYLKPEEFLQRILGRNSTEDSIEVINDLSYDRPLLIRTDRHPSVWTSFDDDYLVFDSYDSTVDVTLQQSKTIVMLNKIPGFTMSDTFTPDMDDNLFPLLLNEVKSWAYLEHKQTSHQKAEQNARIQKSRYQTERSKSTDANRRGRVNYGRR